jgi:REP element-mobilizing transposase RayT
VWTTKHREPVIDESFQRALRKAVTAKTAELDGIAHALGGTADHVHLIASVPPKISLSNFIGQIKGSTSHLINHEIRPGYDFYWQDDYGVVSFGERHLGRLVAYVLNQAQHHEEGSIMGILELASES